MTVCRILDLEEVDSTNTYARTHFAELPDGTLVVAAAQTAGRGRRGRVWLSPPGVNLYATLVVKRCGEAFLAGAMCGLALREAIRTVAPELRTLLKWPNDVYLEDRKIAGILCESAEVTAGRVTGLVAGMGLNVNLGAEDLARIDQPATSLRAAAGRDFDLKKVADGLANSLNRYYSIYSDYPDTLFAEWKKANLLLGQELEVVDGRGAVRRGRFAGIAPDGAMILECGGVRSRFDCGDVRIDRTTIDWEAVLKQI